MGRGSRQSLASISASSAVLTRAVADPPLVLPALKRLPDGRVRTKLYRCGRLRKENDAALSSPELQTINALGDSLRPAERVGRQQGLFCSAHLQGLGRWLAANWLCQLPSEAWEITYEGPEPWVYRVSDYDLASTPLNATRATEAWERYWQSAVPLGAFHADPTQWGSDTDGDGEILIAPEQIRAARPVSLARVLRHARNRDAHEIRALDRQGLRRRS